MLILTRKPGETISIGDDIEVCKDPHIPSDPSDIHLRLVYLHQRTRPDYVNNSLKGRLIEFGRVFLESASDIVFKLVSEQSVQIS